MGYIYTFSHKIINPLYPDESVITITDIAHALSMIPRANGHYPQFYSVARHSLNCCYEAEARCLSKKTQLLCLLHDASEAYLSDIIRDIKECLPDYRAIELRYMKVIEDKFALNVTEKEQTECNQIDNDLLICEFDHFFHECIGELSKEMQHELCFDSNPNMDEKEFFSVYDSLVAQTI